MKAVLVGLLLLQSDPAYVDAPKPRPEQQAAQQLQAQQLQQVPSASKPQPAARPRTFAEQAQSEGMLLANAERCGLRASDLRRLTDTLEDQARERAFKTGAVFDGRQYRRALAGIQGGMAALQGMERRPKPNPYSEECSGVRRQFEDVVYRGIPVKAEGGSQPD